MKQLLNTNNQYSQAIGLLIEKGSKGVTMVDACKDFFFKFQTRLGEVERGRVHKLKISRSRVNGKNRHGHQISYINYKSLASLTYLINLHNKLCKLGTKALK